MRKLDSKHIEFLKANSAILNEILDIRLDQIKERIFSPDAIVNPEEKAVLIKIGQEAKALKGLLAPLPKYNEQEKKSYK